MSRPAGTLASSPQDGLGLQHVGIAIFLSHPRPASDAQRRFTDALVAHLGDRGFLPRTLGVTDYDMNAPLRAIRRMLLECNGILAVAFRRMLVVEGQVLKARARHGGSDDATETVGGAWLTSPWAHIEPALAYELGLPALHIREAGVRAEGLIERGVLGLCGPVLDLDAEAPEAYLRSHEWISVAGTWEGYVRTVFDRKGAPPRLFSS
jgi:hypothetical protein